MDHKLFFIFFTCFVFVICNAMDKGHTTTGTKRKNSEFKYPPPPTKRRKVSKPKNNPAGTKRTKESCLNNPTIEEAKSTDKKVVHIEKTPSWPQGNSPIETFEEFTKKEQGRDLLDYQDYLESYYNSPEETIKISESENNPTGRAEESCLNNQTTEQESRLYEKITGEKSDKAKMLVRGADGYTKAEFFVYLKYRLSQIREKNEESLEQDIARLENALFDAIREQRLGYLENILDPYKVLEIDRIEKAVRRDHQQALCNLKTTFNIPDESWEKFRNEMVHYREKLKGTCLAKPILDIMQSIIWITNGNNHIENLMQQYRINPNSIQLRISSNIETPYVIYPKVEPHEISTRKLYVTPATIFFSPENLNCRHEDPNCKQVCALLYLPYMLTSLYEAYGKESRALLNIIVNLGKEIQEDPSWLEYRRKQTTCNIILSAIRDRGVAERTKSHLEQYINELERHIRLTNVKSDCLLFPYLHLIPLLPLIYRSPTSNEKHQETPDKYEISSTPSYQTF